MKQVVKSFLCVLLLFSAAPVVTSDCGASCGITSSTSSSCGDCDNDCNGCGECHSIFIPQSTGANLAREMYDPTMGPRYDADCFNGGWRLVLEYERSFRDERIAQCLFGGTDTLNFVGSQAGLATAPESFSRVLAAEYFGLSQETAQSISFCPEISNIILDFQMYWGLDNWCNGLFFNINVPFTRTRWKLNARCNDGLVNGASSCNSCDTGCGNDCFDSCNSCDTSCNNDCSFDCNSCCDNLLTCSTPATLIPAGCLNSTAGGVALVDGVTPASSIQEALSGDFLFGDMQTPWRFGRFNFGCETEKGVADVDLILGYNFWNCEDYHLGVYFQAVAPTGTEIDACFAREIFTPIIGNGHFWEVGGGLTAHWELWNCNDDHAISVWLQGNVTHLLHDCQVRTFDFAANGCMSRYLLLKEFTGTGDTLAYNGNLISAVNYTTRYADVSVSVKGNAAIKFIYQHCGWIFGLGYEIYGRSAEDICIRSGFVDGSLADRQFGIKGACAPVAAPGFTTAGVGDAQAIVAPVLNANSPRRLVATQSNATISGCGDTDSPFDLINLATPGFVYVDACQNLVGTAVGTDIGDGLVVAVDSLAAGATVAAVTGLVTGTPASVLLTGDASELNANSARAPRQISNKVFGTIDYMWRDCDWSPFVGVAGEGVFASRDECCTLNKWGVWVRGGFNW
jgi:hypothetical protein